MESMRRISGRAPGSSVWKSWGHERIEFGVVAGRGLLAVERAAELVETMANIEIDVGGFDSERGLLKPQDYCDLPNVIFDGQYPYG